MEWSIRGLLNPVITRLLIYGVNPIDVEYVVSKVENMNHMHACSMENAWAAEWEKKGDFYRTLAENSLSKGNRVTAGELFMQAAQCYYAIFLINLTSLEHKKRIYENYAQYYRKSVACTTSPLKKIDISIDNKTSLAGYLHLPSSAVDNKKLCAIIFSGLGSCKEEMHTLAAPLLARGVSVFIPDMPGNGESLFSRDITCNIDLLEKTFTSIPGNLDTIPELSGFTYGVYGLCMGGGYAVRAACVNTQYRFCVTLFPLLISKVQENSTPQWMKQSDWAKYQMGNIPPTQFIDEMRLLEQGTLECPYLFIHGRHDNWMTLDNALQFCDRSKGKTEKIIIDSEPVFSNQQLVTHTMPVGEQLHWIRHVAADWIASQK